METNSHILVESTSMLTPAFPCYGGPKDGGFFPVGQCPIGYKEFEVRGNTIFLYSMMRTEHLNFAILHKASKAKPKDYNLGEDYP